VTSSAVPPEAAAGHPPGGSGAPGARRPLDRQAVAGRGLAALLGAGVAGELVFEAIAWGVAPLVIDMPVQPAFLIAMLLDRLVGQDLNYGGAFILHFLSGVALFPVAYRLIVGPLADRRGLAAGFVWGLALWLAAQGLLSPLAGGVPFGGPGLYAPVSLGAYLAYALVVAVVYPRLLAWMGGAGAPAPADRAAASG
jgi:hypothetical protein